MSKLDYRVASPSKGRWHLMPKLLKLVPEILVCVEAAEADRYLEFGVPKGQLVVHPALDGLLPKRNWMLDNIDGECQIQVDDDVDNVRRLTGSYKTIRDPDFIRQLFENSYRMAKDLELGVFAYSRLPNRMMAKPEVQPFQLCGMMANVIGVLGPARHRYRDVSMVGRADVDFSLQTALVDRIALIDRRYFFNCGPVFSGKGGMNSVTTDREATWKKSAKLLDKKWPGCVEIKAGGGAGGTSKYTERVSFKIRRTSPAAVR